MADRSCSLPHGWRRKPFSALANVSFSGVDKKSTPGEIPVRLCNYVDVFHNHRIHSGIDFMAATATEREVAKFRLLRGDVVFTKDSETSAEIAEPAFVAEDLNGVVCGYHLAIARPKKDVDGRFLYYAMKETGVRRQFMRSANGITRFGLTLDAFDQILVLTPLLKEQIRIAEILATWDAAIEAARQARDLLDMQYRAIAADGIHLRGHNMRPLKDLLTPDRMQAVEPNGPFRALGVRSHGKGTFQREDDLTANGSTKTVYRVEADRFVVNIVFAWEGAAAITSQDDAGCLVSHRFPTFTINREALSLEYFRHLIRTEPFRQLLALASPGGAGRNKTLNRSDFLKFEIHVPPLPEQTAVEMALGTLDRRITLLDEYLQRLTIQRDALATELLTGRLRVPQAEAAS